MWGVRGLGFGFTNPVETGGVWDECLCLGCGGVGGLGGVVMVCVGGVMYVCVVSLDYLCRWQVHLSVFCSRRIPAHLRCTQSSHLLHLIDICFLTRICLWDISQIQTCTWVVGPGLVLASTAFMISSVSHPAGPHDQLTQNILVVTH